jgi:transketolase
MLDEKKIKNYSRIGSRATFGLVALELGRLIENLMILTADVSTSAGLDRFKKTYPEKYLDVGIAEQNLISVAAGLASEGYKVITTTFAPFQTMRCCEQIKINLGYMENDVCMVGLASGVVLGTLGYTHCCIEDLSLMRSIPGLKVLSPADCGATAKAIDAAMKAGGPTYIRLTGGARNEIVYESDFEFNIGRGIEVKSGEDIVLLATGTMVSTSLRAATLIESEISGSVGVYDIHSIKPIDKELIQNVSSRSKVIATVEEHSIVGGLGSAVSEVKSQLEGGAPQILFGLPDHYGHGGEYDSLLQSSGLTSENIAQSLTNKYRTVST